MFLLANLLVAVAQILDYTLWAYTWIIIGRVAVSYINVDTQNPLVRFLYATTEPVLEKVRERLPVSTGAFDWSPIVVWIGVVFLQQFLVRSLFDIANALR